jgi:hypothetical protein
MDMDECLLASGSVTAIIKKNAAYFALEDHNFAPLIGFT